MNSDFRLCVAGVHLIYVSYADKQHLASTEEQRALCRDLQVRYDYHDRLVGALSQLVDWLDLDEGDDPSDFAKSLLSKLENMERNQ